MIKTGQCITINESENQLILTRRDLEAYTIYRCNNINVTPRPHTSKNADELIEEIVKWIKRGYEE